MAPASRPAYILKSRYEWHIEYRMAKTSADVFIVLKGAALALVQRYNDPARPYLLPWLGVAEE